MRFFSGTFLLAMFLATAPIVSQAQPGMAQQQMQLTAEQKQLVNELQQAQMKFQETEAIIRKLEEKTINQSKSLQTQRDELDKLVSNKMNSGGYNAKKEAQELQAIMQKYQKAKEKPSQDVIADFQKRQMKLQQKQAAAMQDPEVQKAINDFNDAMMVEAKKIDPNTDALLARLKSQIEKVQSIRQKMQETMVK